MNLSQWLSYLQSTQHEGNLWVKRQTDKILRPHDTISSEIGNAYGRCPRYELSDFMSLWLAFKEIEVFIESVNSNLEFGETAPDRLARQRYVEVQQSFNDYGKSFNAHKLRSNILTLFIVSKQGEIASRPISTDHVANSPDETNLGESQTIASVNFSDCAPYSDSVQPQLNIVRSHNVGESNLTSHCI